MSVRIEFNSEGFKEILLSDGVKDIVTNASNDIQQRAGEGFYARIAYGNYGGGRWIGYVGADTREAMIAESEYKALSGAI